MVILADLLTLAIFFEGRMRGGRGIGSRCKWKPHRIHGTQKSWNYKRHMLVDSEKWKLWVRTHKSFNLFKMSCSVSLLGAPSELDGESYRGDYTCHHCDDPTPPNSPNSSVKFPTWKGYTEGVNVLLVKVKNRIWAWESSSVGSTYMVTEAVKAAHIYTQKISHLRIHGCLFVSLAFSWHSWEQKQLCSFWHVTYMIFLFH